MAISIVKVLRKDKVNSKMFTPINIRLILNRKTIYIPTGISIPIDMWDCTRNEPLTSYEEGAKIALKLDEMVLNIEKRIQQLEVLDLPITLEALTKKHKPASNISVAEYMEDLCTSLKKANRLSSAQNYKSCLASLSQYRPMEIVRFGDIDLHFIKGYERFLRAKGCSDNSIASRMRLLKATYNRAYAEKVFISEENPFQHYKIGNPITPQPDNFYNLGKALRTYAPNMSTDKMTLMGMAVDSLLYNSTQGYFELTDENREALKRFFVGNNDLAVVENGSLRKVGKCVCSVQCGELFGESPLPMGEEFVWMDGKFTSVGMDYLVFKGTIDTRFKDVNGGAAYAQVGTYTFAVYEDDERGVVCGLVDRQHPYQGNRDILILLNKDLHAPSTHLTEEEVAHLVGYDIDDPTAYHQDHTKFYAKLNLDSPVKPAWKTVTAEVGDTAVCYARCKHLVFSKGKRNKVLEKINRQNYELIFEQYADSEKIDIVGALERMFRSNFENELEISPEELIGKPLYMWVEQSAKTIYGGKILCVVTENTIYLGGSHELFYNEIHQYNLTTGELIDLSYLHRGEWVEQLDKAIYDHLPDFTRPHKDNPDDLTLFADIMITERGLLFQYKPYEVASFADGFVEVELSNEELASLGVPMPWR